MPDSQSSGRPGMTGKVTSSGSPPSSSQAGAGGGASAVVAPAAGVSGEWAGMIRPDLEVAGRFAGRRRLGAGAANPLRGRGRGRRRRRRLPGAGLADRCRLAAGTSAGAVSSGRSPRRDHAADVPAGRTRSSSRNAPAATAARTASVLSPRSSSRLSAWKTSQIAKGPSDPFDPTRPSGDSSLNATARTPSPRPSPRWGEGDRLFPSATVYSLGDGRHRPLLPSGEKVPEGRMRGVLAPRRHGPLPRSARWCSARSLLVRGSPSLPGRRYGP